MLQRLANALKITMSFRDYYLHLDKEHIQRIVKAFLKLDAVDQLAVCQCIEAMNSSEIRFPLYKLSHTMVLHLFQGMDRLKYRYQTKSHSAQYQHDLAKFTVEAKTILLISHVYGLNHVELMDLRVRDLKINSGYAVLGDRQAVQTGSLGALQRPYTATVVSWHRLCQHEDAHSFLFPNIQPINEWSRIKATRFNAAVRFMFLAAPTLL